MAFKFKLVEDLDPRFEKAKSDYRHYADIDNDAIITNENLNDWALNEAAIKNGMRKFDLKDILLNEEIKADTCEDCGDDLHDDEDDKDEDESEVEALEEDVTIDQAAREADAEIETAEGKGQIQTALDKALKRARRVQGQKGADFPNIILVGDAGSGKAQPLTSKVYTPTGYKLMGDIKPGDDVLDGKGNPTKVTAVFPQGKRDIYRINFDDNTFIEVADCHLNSVYTTNQKYGADFDKSKPVGEKIDMVLNTLDLLKIVNSSKYGSSNGPRLYVEQPSIHGWTNEDLPIDPYLLGCLIGDGNLKGNDIGFTTADKEIKDELNYILLRDWKLTLKPQSNKEDCMDFSIFNYYPEDRGKQTKGYGRTEFRKTLKSLGLDVTSPYKHIPDVYLYSSFESRLRLLQGLMDTDGYVGKTGKGECVFNTTSSRLANDVAFLCRSLGCKIKLKVQANRTYHYTYHYKNKCVDEIRPCLDCYDININQPKGLKIVSLPRKLERIHDEKKSPYYGRKGIVSVKFDRVDECQCIMVESPEHTYITDNLTLTHNSAIVRQWAKENGINLVYKDIKTITPTDLGGLKMRDLDDPDYAKRVGSKEFIQALSKPNSVLFLDEYNRAKTEVRGTLLTLVNEHVVWDPKAEGEEAFLPNFLFTIMAINPATGAYPGARDLDPAERSRARRVNVQMIPEEHLAYLRKVYAKEIEEAEDPQDKLECEGRLAIAEKILTDKTFYYDTPDEVIDMHDDPSWVPLNYRSFKKLLDETDGTKKDFLNNWNDYCNYKKKGLVETILSDYVDVQDKANDALKGGSQSSVFGKNLSNLDKLFDKYPELKN